MRGCGRPARPMELRLTADPRDDLTRHRLRNVVRSSHSCCSAWRGGSGARALLEGGFVGAHGGDDRRPLGGVRRPVPRSKAAALSPESPNWSAIGPRASPSHGTREPHSQAAGLDVTQGTPEAALCWPGWENPKARGSGYHPERPARSGPAGMQPQAAQVTL